ncbi:MAG: recombination-associated protein RdgC [Zoogloeaceae bacterium]|nr:recombination-associated protein RdgC [Zoogloeaceae bacterium]
MWFKNLQVFRLPAPWSVDRASLEDQLAKRRFHPCGSLDPATQGWVPPTQESSLVHVVGQQWLICLGSESKILPSSVVRQEAEDRADDIEAAQGFRPGRKQMRELREQVLQELLPRAFTRRRRSFAWIDPVNGWLVVDAPSQARAEDLLEELRASLDHFPLALLRTERSPGSAMAEWLAAGEAPGAFTIDQDCELRSVTEEKAAVRYVRHSLEGEEIRGHLQAGKLPTRLALTFDDRVSFVLTEKGEIKRLQFLDVVQEQMEGQGEGAAELFDAEFALMTGELSHLLPALVAALGGEITA